MSKKTENRRTRRIRKMVCLTDPEIIRRIRRVQRDEHRKSFAGTCEALVLRGLAAADGS